MKLKSVLVGSLLLIAGASLAQDDSTAVNQDVAEEAVVTEETDDLIHETFQSTHMINGHSVETLRKGVLEFRVEHRFGDIAGDDGGSQTMFGLDNASDIRLGFDYGITDKLMAGIGRSKGTGSPYRSLIDGFLKYRFLQQKTKGMPVSAALVGTAFYTYMKASSDVSQVNHFPKDVYRFSYMAQLNIARKFGEKVGVALMPTVLHRNYVANTDMNTLFAMGGAVRFALNSTSSILLEYYQVLADDDKRTGSYQNSLSIAYEWVTFGHNFTVLLTNSKGLGETQFIPYTYENWTKGQFRIGFCIGRKFDFSH